jgi:6-O-methylguanine DNA methyltransferase, DNA binding domain
MALIIPCHRVLAAGGKVGGFSAPGGSAAKIRMLELKRIHRLSDIRVLRLRAPSSKAEK